MKLQLRNVLEIVYEAIRCKSGKLLGIAIETLSSASYAPEHPISIALRFVRVNPMETKTLKVFVSIMEEILRSEERNEVASTNNVSLS